jgi:hypothetical protein
LLVERWFTIQDSVPRIRRRSKDGKAMTAKEEEFVTQFVRECVFASCCLSVDTPSSGRWEDRVEEVLLTQSIDSEGAQT